MDDFNALFTQMTTLNKQMQNIETKTHVHAKATQVLSCEFCRNDHSQEQCPLHTERVNFIGKYNKNQNNPHSNSYNLSWRNNLNFESGGNQARGQKLQAQAQHHQDFKQNTKQDATTSEKMLMEGMFIQIMQTQQ